MASPLSSGVRRKNRQLSRWRFFYARWLPAPGPLRLPPARARLMKSTRTYWFHGHQHDLL